MALFFDAVWFEARLAAMGLDKGALAQGLGLSEAELAAVWKDQRMLSDREFAVLALLLGEPEAQVRVRAGVQGAPHPMDLSDRVAALEARVARLEAALARAASAANPD